MRHFARQNAYGLQKATSGNEFSGVVLNETNGCLGTAGMK